MFGKTWSLVSYQQDKLYCFRKVYTIRIDEVNKNIYYLEELFTFTAKSRDIWVLMLLQNLINCSTCSDQLSVKFKK
jgi:hypothetical protein